MTADASNPNPGTEFGPAEEMPLGGGLDYRTIFNVAGNGMAFTEFGSGRILDVNATWLRATGLDREEAIGRKALELGLWADTAEREACLDALRTNGRVVDFEARLVMRAEDRPHLISAVIVEMAGNKCVLWEFRDITEQKRAAEALRKNDELLRSYLNSSSLIAWLKDEDGRHVFLSDSYQKRFNVRVEDWKGKTDFELWPGEVAEEFRRNDLAVLHGGRPIELTEKAVEPDGHVSWWLNTKFPFQDASGKRFVGGIGVDITDRKRSQDAAEQERALMLAIMNATDVMLVYLNLSFHYIAVNNAYAATCRMRPEEMAGKSHFALYPDPENEAIFRRVRDTGEPVFFKDKPFEFPDQPERGVTYWDWSLVPVREKSGRIQGLVMSLRESTKFKKVELALRESEERLEMAQMAAKAGAWDWNVVTGRIEWSSHLFDLFGIDPLRGRVSYEAWEKALHPDDREIARVSIDRALKQKTTLNSDYRVVLPDGQVRWINAIGEGRYDDQGRPVRMIGFCIDITDRKQSEEKLRDSEKRFRSYFELPFHGVAITSLDKGWIEVNNRICSMLGYSRDEITRMTWAQMTYPDDLAADVEQFDRILSGRIDSYSMDKRFIRKDGTVIWAHLDVGCVRTPDGRVDYFVAVLVDITERKKAEEALRANEERLHLATRAANIGVWDWDIVKNEITWDDSMYSLYGIDKKDFSGAVEAWSRSVHPDDLDYAQAEIQAAFRGEREYSPEFRIIRPDGTIRHIQAASRTYFDGQGKPLRMIGTNIDITERKKAEEELRQARALLQAAMDQSPAGIAIADAPEGKLRYVNDAGLLIRGGDRKAIVSGVGINEYVSRWQILDFDGRPLRPDEVPLARAVLFGETCSREFIVRRSDEDDRIVSANASPILDQSGKVVAGIVVFTDITDRRRAEEDREKLQEQLKQAQKMESIGRLAGGVAHDFNNMLMVILGYADILMKNCSTEDPQYGMIREIQRAASRSADLTKQLLAFARKQTIAPKVMDLNQTVPGMLKMLQRLIGEDIQLAWIPGPVLWPVRIDPAQLDQVLANLCVNARDAIAGHGRLSIGTGNVTIDFESGSAYGSCPPGDYVCLTVSDTGCGMKKEVLDHIFDPFFTTKEFGKGTGLGLSTVYGIVMQNSGCISVASEPGSGTTFKMLLPRFAGPDEEAGAEPDSEPPWGRGETVLFVEDERAMLQTGKILLESLGYRVLVAPSASEAIRLAEADPGGIDLLVTDVIMPNMNGRELADRLKALIPGLPCLFMSGYPDDVIEGVIEKETHFVGKPFSLKDIAMKVRAALENG